MDLSKVSDQDLLAYKEGRLADVSDDGLVAIKGSMSSAESPKKETGDAEKAVNLGLKYAQGRSFGVAPKVMAGIGAVMAKPVLEGIEAASEAGLTANEYEAPSIAGAYKKIYGDFRGHLDQADQDNPVLSLLAEAAGGIRTSAQTGQSPIGQRVSGWVRSGELPKNATLAERAANVLKKAGKGALVGEAGYRAYKAGTADAGEEGKELISGFPWGGVAGSVGPLLSSGVSAITPQADEGLKAVGEIAKKYNIPLSVDQITQTKPIKNLQKISQELPFSGHDAFRDKQMKAFNRALTKSIGHESDKITPEVMDKAFTRVGHEFDKLGKGKSFIVGKEFDDAISNILEDANASYTDEAIKKFNNALGIVKRNVQPDGRISGESLGFVRNRLNKLARKASDADTKELLGDLENAVVDLMTAGDDAAQGALSKAKYQYKNLLAIEPLAQKSKAGNISPSLLNNRVAKIYGRQYTRGKAGELGDLARVGNELLPELGGSDTAQKFLYGGATIAGVANPSTTLLTPAALAGNKAYQSWFNQNQDIVQKILQDEFEKAMLAPPTSTSGALGTAAGILEGK